MADRLGARLLASIRRTEFPLLLRHWKRSDRNRPLDRERVDLLLGRVWTAAVPNALHYRSIWRAVDRSPPHWRHRVHVRSAPAATDPSAQPVSCSHTAAASVGDPSPWL